MDSRPIVLSLCDRTGNILKPWARTGLFRCIAVDIQHPTSGREENGIEYTHADVRDYLPPLGEYVFACAFPPCTHLAVSGARWFQSKGLAKLKEAIELVAQCERLCEWTGAPYFIENPVSTLSTYWRKPDYTFDPCEYGGYLPEEEKDADSYTKKTCLWTGGYFILPDKKPVPPTQGSKMHRLPPSENRADLRSETPMGFAEAVYQANSPHVSYFRTRVRNMKRKMDEI